MSVEDNKAKVRHFYDEVWNKDNGDAAEEIFAEDYIRHDLRPTKAIPGPEGQKRIAADFRRAFPDLEFSIQLLFGEDDLVAARWIARGTNTGSWGQIEPTGKRVEFSRVNIFRFAGGKVVEIWNQRDDLGLMQQLGVPVFTGAAGTGEN